MDLAGFHEIVTPLDQIDSRSEPANTPYLTKSRRSYYLCCWASLRFDLDRLGLLFHDLAAISVCSELLRHFPERFRFTPLRALRALRSVNRNRSGNWLRNSPHTPILPNHSRSGQIDPDRSSGRPNSKDSYNLHNACKIIEITREWFLKPRFAQTE